MDPKDDVVTATSPSDLRKKLRSQGIAAATEVTVVTGFVGPQNAAVLFPDTHGKPVGVGFSTTLISADEANALVRELTVLVRGGVRRVHAFTVVFYRRG